MKVSSVEWKQIGLRIRNARLGKKMRQSDLASILKITVASISAYENGIKKIDFVNLKMLCKILDIDIRTL